MDNDDIHALETAKEAAYRQYAETAQQLHEAYWNRLLTQLPSIIEAIAQRYPEAVVEAEHTEWTNSDEFMFDHWVYVRFPKRLSIDDMAAFFEWLKDAVPLSRENGLSFVPI